MISGLINTLSADVFAPAEVGTANGFIGQAGWIGGLLFSLLIGQLADTVGYAPLFAVLAVFDLIGAAVLSSSSAADAVRHQPRDSGARPMRRATLSQPPRFAVTGRSRGISD